MRCDLKYILKGQILYTLALLEEKASIVIGIITFNKWLYRLVSQYDLVSLVLF
jgi:hypothetical protein